MKKFMIVAALPMVMSACSSYTYHSINNDRVDLSTYRTYAWLPSRTTKAEEYFANDIAEEKVMDAANQELVERGYRLENAKPDLLVKFTANVNPRTKTLRDPVYYQAPARYEPRYAVSKGRVYSYYQYVNPFPVYVGSEVRKVNYDEGNIVIDLIDRKTSKVIWRGWGKGELNDPEKAIADLPKVIGHIFEKLPGS